MVVGLFDLPGLQIHAAGPGQCQLITLPFTAGHELAGSAGDWPLPSPALGAYRVAWTVDVDAIPSLLVPFARSVPAESFGPKQKEKGRDIETSRCQLVGGTGLPASRPTTFWTEHSNAAVHALPTPRARATQMATSFDGRQRVRNSSMAITQNVKLAAVSACR